MSADHDPGSFEHELAPPDPATIFAAIELAKAPPLPDESHPFRQSVYLAVAVLCVECNTIYAGEADTHKAGLDALGCPVCGNRNYFAVSRIIR